MSNNKNKAFTLLEILLVVGIISIVAGIVIVAINPTNSLAKTRDLQRKMGVAEIDNALAQYYLNNGQYPDSIDTNLQNICVTGAATSGASCSGQINLSVLVPNYLDAIPNDPTGVGYQVGLSNTGHVVVVASLTETGPVISAGDNPIDTNPNITLGDGSVSNPYQVDNWSQLNHVRDNLAASYILTASLSSSTYGYAGIGSSWSPIGTFGTPFSGNFNGNKKTISDLVPGDASLSYDSTDKNNQNQAAAVLLAAGGGGGGGGYLCGFGPHSNAIPGTIPSAGLFGYLNGNVSRVGLINTTIDQAWGYYGALAGYQKGGTISNCYSTGSIRGRQFGIGGLVGFQESSGVINNSYSGATVMGYSGVGGLVGQTFGTVSNSYATGYVKGQFRSIGGLVGESDGGTISNSYSTGNLCLDTIASAYGGLLGAEYTGGTTSNSYWDIKSSGQSTSADGVGVTTTAMQTPSTYTGWDTSTIWNISNGSYPTLK